MNETWRIIELTENNAYLNMAIDDAILDEIGDGKSQPTIRFYRWLPNAVSIGRFQGMNDEVNIQKCADLNIDVVRRITGGGAVYHDYHGELTYSVIGKEELFPDGIHESYRYICNWIIDGLKSIGINAEFAPINDIIVDGRKISGNAQTRKKGVLLQHGTILYKIDISKMFSVLNISKEKISDKMIKNAEDRVTSVSLQAKSSFNELYEAILNSFKNGKKYEFGSLTTPELEKVREFEKIYRSYEWNFKQ
jgi:lipoate-protein ligase A